MTKFDAKKSLDWYRAAEGEFRLVDVPVTRYLAIDGSGDPNSSPDYRTALEALYPFAYALKFLSKRELDCDYVVPPLEGLWWADDMRSFTELRDKSAWHWTMLLMVPDWLTAQHVAQARERAMERKPDARIEEVRLLALDEGTCAQTLHVGSFDDEAAVLHRMHHDFMPAQGYALTGRHHEIYFSDPRRVAPNSLRTLLRQPVAPAGR